MEMKHLLDFVRGVYEDKIFFIFFKGCTWMKFFQDTWKMKILQVFIKGV